MDNNNDRNDDLRCGDAERSHTAERLNEALAAGQLSVPEFDERTRLAYSAQTQQDLERLTADLGPRLRPHSPAPSGTAQRYSFTLFGGSRPKPSRLSDKHTSLAAFGGIELDLRECELSEPYTEIKAFAAFGGVEIRVPENARVEVDGIGIFGGFDKRGLDTAPADGPLIRVSGLAAFGGVQVRRG